MEYEDEHGMPETDGEQDMKCEIKMLDDVLHMDFYQKCGEERDNRDIGRMEAKNIDGTAETIGGKKITITRQYVQGSGVVKKNV